MVRKKLYKFIAMILTGSVLLTQPSVMQLAGTVPVYAEEAAEQAEAASVSSSEAEGEVNPSEENTGDEASDDSTSETTSEDTSATSSEEKTTGEEQTEESKESMDSEVPSGSSSESADQKENPDEKKDEEEASKYTGMSDEEFLASIVNDLGEAVDNGDSPSPEKITAAISQFIASLDKIIGKKPDGTTYLQDILADLNGIGTGANSIIAFLKIAGILKDPTTESLNKIFDELQRQNQTLKTMSETLNELSRKLDDIQFEQKRQTRKNEATNASVAYTNFVHDYFEPLERALDDYTTAMKNGLAEWCEYPDVASSLAVYYTVINQEKKQAYSTAFLNKTSVEKSDDYKSIYPRFTIELPENYVYEALVQYNLESDPQEAIDTDKLLTCLKNQVIKAADNKKILVGAQSNFYSSWAKYNEQERNDRAEEIAEGLFNNLMYTISVSYARTTNVNKLKQDYNYLCTELLKSNTGLPAYYTLMTNLYSFEGEISKEVQLTVYSYYAYVVLYEAFITTLLRQKGDRSGAIQQIQTSMVNVSPNIPVFLENNLGRGDNFCYVTGSLITFEEREITSSTSFITDEWTSGGDQYIRYISTEADPIKISGSDITTIVDSLSLRMIHNGYKTLYNTDTTSFSKYLNGNGTSCPEDFDGSFASDIKKPDTFALDEKIPMTAYMGQVSQSWSMYGGYVQNQVYKIDEKHEALSHWDVHDKVIGTLTTIKKESINTSDKNKEPLFSRAAFSHRKKIWKKDHLWYFSDSPTEHSWSKEKDLRSEFISSKKIYTLVMTPVQKKAEVSSDCNEEVCLNILDHMIAEIEESNNALQETENSVEENKKTLSAWSSYEPETEYLDCSDQEVEEFFKSYIDNLAEKGIDGTAIKLSDNSKTIIFDAISKKITKACEEYINNDSLDFTVSCDPFNIYGNETAMTELAKEVLLNCYKDENGDPLIPVENMITAAIIEPLATLNFKKQDGKTKAVVGNAVEVEPVLFVWHAGSDSYMCFRISNEVMTKLGLTMNVRLSAASLGDSTRAKVIHYDDYDTMNEVERFTVDVQGSGNNRYVEVKVASCSPFAVASASAQGEDADDDNNSGSGNNGSKGNGSSSGSSSAKGGTSSGSSAKGVSSVKTGDTTNVVPYIILFLIAAACLGGIVIYRRKKQ